MNTFTVYRADDSSVIFGEHLTAVEAAQRILDHDDHRFEMRQDDGFWTLYVSDARGAMVPCWSNGRLCHALVETEEEAWAKIVPMILFHDWPGHPAAMADDDFAAMQAEFEDA